jgi:hypothetical protein
VSYVAMLSEVQDNFVDTIVSAQGLDANTLERGWSALVTVGTIVAAVFIAMYWSHNADAEMTKTKPAEKSGASRVMNKTGFLARFAAFVGSAHAPQTAVAAVDKDVQMAEQALPMILRSSTLASRVQDEMKHHHKWFGVVFYYSAAFPRVLRVLSLTTNVTIMLFVQSITYTLTNPDNGTCETYQVKSECLAEPSPYQTGASKCFWDGKTDTCGLVQPDDSVRVVLFVAIFSALISTPLAVGIDWVIMFLLASQTRQAVPTVPAHIRGSLIDLKLRSLSRRRQTAAPGERSTEASMKDGECQSSRSMEEGVRAPEAPSPTNRTSVARSSRQSSRGSRSVVGSINMLSWRGTISGASPEEQRRQGEIGAQAQADLRALIAGLAQYRGGLTGEEKVDFDGKRVMPVFLATFCFILMV